MSIKTKKKSKKKLITTIIIVTVAALLIVPLLTRPRGSAFTEVKPVKGDITTYYSFSGSVEAKNRETVMAGRVMQVKEIMVEEGETVKKDDILMETTAGEEIKAKIDGEISKIYIEENGQVMAGGKLMDIVDYSDLQLVVQVDEYDLLAIQKDKDAQVAIHAISNQIPGKIIDISKEGTYLNGVTFFTATISLQKDSDVRVGMSAEARVLNKSVKDVLTLSMSSIQFDDSNKPYVLVKGEKGAAVRRDLTIGINDGIQVEIKEGVTLNDTIMVAEKKINTSFGPGRALRGGNGGNNNNNSNSSSNGGRTQ